MAEERSLSAIELNRYPDLYSASICIPYFLSFSINLKTAFFDISKLCAITSPDTYISASLGMPSIFPVRFMEIVP